MITYESIYFRYASLFRIIIITAILYSRRFFMLIKNGFLIDPATKKSGNYDIRIENGIITEIGNTLSPAPNEQVTDAAGLTVAPGLIDTHIHFRDPGFTYKENIHTGSQAAAAGGFTSVICMANTSPVVDNTETLTDILERAKDEKYTFIRPLPSLINCAAKK